VGFAQEIKDFTAAYTAVSDIGYKKKDQKLQEEKQKHDIEYENALLALKQEEFGLKKAKLEAGSGGTGGTGGSGGKSSGSGSGSGKGALPTTGLGMDFDNNVSTTENRTQDYNREVADAAIGAVDEEAYNDTLGDDAADDILSGNYEEGGVVEEAVPVKAGPFKVAGPKPAAKPATTKPIPAAAAIPEAATASATSPAAVPAAPAEEPAAPKVDPKATTIVVRKSMEAAGAALDSAEKSYRAPKPAVGGEEGDGVDLATGEGGMTFDEYEKIGEVVDPNGAIPVELRSAAKLSAVYNYFKDTGDEAKAVKAAKGYLAAEMRVNQTLGLLAENAFEQGNVAAGCKIINDACSRFPSGHKIVVAPVESGRYVYEVTDPTGKVMEKEAISTDELMESVAGIKDGTLYKKMLAHAVVGARPAKGEEGGGYTAALADVQASYQGLIAAQAAYEALPEDTPIADKRAAHAAIQAASEALETSKAAAQKAGVSAISGDGNNASKEAAIIQDIQGAMKPPGEGENAGGVGAIPAAPTPNEGGWFGWGAEEDSAAAPAAAPAATAPALDTTVPAAAPVEEAPAKSALPPAPEAVLKKAAAAIANGAPREAVLKRLQDAGYSAEGL
jgi:hypothetical protein